MKKIIYILLALVSLTLIAYTGYYTMNNNVPEPTIVATSTEEIIATTESPAPDAKKTLMAKNGKQIEVIESNPSGVSLSTITLTPSGFSSNTPIILETNKLTDFFLADLNSDASDELILITEAQGSGSYGDAIIYTTASSSKMIPVTLPEIDESDTNVGGLFEGYMGHDIFKVIGTSLIREFPIFKETDTNATKPTSTRSVIYSLSEKNGAYFVTFKKYTPSIKAATSTLGAVVSTTSKQTSTASSTMGTSTLPRP